MQAANPYDSVAALTHYIQAPFTSVLGRLVCEELMSVEAIFDVVDHINSDPQRARDAIIVFEEIFRHEGSSRILYAVEVFEYLVKNCNMNLHQAANTQSFVESIIGLLRRLRGKFNFIERLARNIQNWIKIEAKLWYDAFIMSEDDLPYLVGIYRMLKKENITFPPRQQEEKNMIAVVTKSPIFENLAVIVESDRAEFDKKKKALGGLNIEERTTEQYKLNCLETTSTINSSKILAPIYQQIIYKFDSQKIQAIIQQAKQQEPNQEDGVGQQLLKFLQCTEHEVSQENSIILQKFRQEAQTIVQKWRNQAKQIPLTQIDIQLIEKQEKIQLKKNQKNIVERQVDNHDVVFFDIQ